LKIIEVVVVVVKYQKLMMMKNIKTVMRKEKKKKKKRLYSVLVVVEEIVRKCQKTALNLDTDRIVVIYQIFTSLLLPTLPSRSPTSLAP